MWKDDKFFREVEPNCWCVPRACRGSPRRTGRANASPAPRDADARLKECDEAGVDVQVRLQLGLGPWVPLPRPRKAPQALRPRFATSFRRSALTSRTATGPLHRSGHVQLLGQARGHPGPVAPAQRRLGGHRPAEPEALCRCAFPSLRASGMPQFCAVFTRPSPLPSAWYNPDAGAESRKAGAAALCDRARFRGRAGVCLQARGGTRSARAPHRVSPGSVPQIGSHVNDWTLDQEDMFEVFEEGASLLRGRPSRAGAPSPPPARDAADRLGACILVHPWDMMGKDMMNKYWLPWYALSPCALTSCTAPAQRSAPSRPTHPRPLRSGWWACRPRCPLPSALASSAACSSGCPACESCSPTAAAPSPAQLVRCAPPARRLHHRAQGLLVGPTHGGLWIRWTSDP